MSRGRSAFATVAVLGVFAFLYSFVLAIPVYVSDVAELWRARGHAWFGLNGIVRSGNDETDTDN